MLGSLGILAVSSLYRIELQQEGIRREYIARDRAFEGLRSNIYLSGTLVRDSLLDGGAARSEEQTARFRVLQAAIRKGMAEYSRLLNDPQDPESAAFRASLETFLHRTANLFEISGSKRARELAQGEVSPARARLMEQAERMRKLGDRQTERSGNAVLANLSDFRLRLGILSLSAVGVGMLLAGFTLRRILHLERESQRLSKDLMTSGEEERRRISRELHDEVGQSLYATMLGLGNLRSSLGTEEALEQIAQLETMASRTVSVVRNISLLLRPAMLDDLGLVPAVKWLARETKRMHGVPVEVSAEGFPEEVPEEQVTCIYRVVQEALHNAVKHAEAAEIRVSLVADSRLRGRVEDSGKGFESHAELGMGILGMRERLERLGGTLGVESKPGLGTAVVFELPIK